MSSIDTFEYSTTGFDLSSGQVIQRFVLDEDLLVLGTLPNTFEVRRRDSGGNYPVVSTITMTGLGPIINGNWFGAVDQNQVLTIAKFANNQISNPVTLSGYKVSGAKLFDNNTLALFDSTTNSVVTLQYNSGKNSWDELYRQVLNSFIFAPLNIGFQLPPNYPTLCFQDKYFFGLNVTVGSSGTPELTFTMMELQTDLSWTVVEQFPFPSVDVNYANGLSTYNGVDTIAISAPMKPQSTGTSGEISIFKKNQQGEWSLQQTIIPDDLGYRGTSMLGAGLKFKSPTTLLVSGPMENSINNSPNLAGGGKMTYLELNSTTSTWEPQIDMTSTSGESILFGTGIDINSEHILTFGVGLSNTSQSGLIGRLYAISPCYTEPIHVTCLNATLDDCSDLTLDSLYTFDASCGAVDITVNGMSIVGNTFTARFSFAKRDQTVSCNATVYCPAATSPPSSVAPTTQQTPTSPSNVTPSAPSSAAPTSTNSPQSNQPEALAPKTVDPGATSPESNSVSIASIASVSVTIFVTLVALCL